MVSDKNRQKILVVDDTPENISVLVELLRNDYAIIVATGGERALHLARSLPAPDLILLDIMMPDMDGYEVCKRLKADNKTAEIPILFITALKDKESELKGLKNGAVDYITKPFYPELVKRRVKIHLELQQHRRHLEDLVLKRTKELEELNRELNNRVSDELEKNREKDQYLAHQARFAAMGQMMSAIAHQWRQPLNNIGLIIQSASLDFKDGKLDQERFDCMVAEAMSSLSFLSETITIFRDFFRGKASGPQFDLLQTVERTCALLRAELDNLGIKIKVTSEETTLLKGNATELSHAIINIINNAMEALIERKTGEPVIEISCEITKLTARVVICDNAGGIPEEVIDNIFDPYFTTKFMSQGTGIGLYLTRMIIEKQLKGMVKVQNRERGAAFTIELPLDAD